MGAKLSRGISKKSLDKETEIHNLIRGIASEYLKGIDGNEMMKLLDPTVCERYVVLSHDAISLLVKHIKTKTGKRGMIRSYIVIPKTDFDKISHETQRYPEEYSIERERESSSSSRTLQKSTRRVSKAKEIDCVALAEKYVKILHLFAAIRFAIKGIDAQDFTAIDSRNDNTGYKDVVGKVLPEKQIASPPCRERLKDLAISIGRNDKERIKELREKKQEEYPFKNLGNFIQILDNDAYNNGTYNPLTPQSIQNLGEDANKLSGIYYGQSTRSFERIDKIEVDRNEGSIDTVSLEKDLATADGKYIESVNKLMEILKQIFDSNTYNIKPLNDFTVESLMNQTKEIILNMEGNCEKDYGKIIHKLKDIAKGQADGQAEGQANRQAEGQAEVQGNGQAEEQADNVTAGSNSSMPPPNRPSTPQDPSQLTSIARLVEIQDERNNPRRQSPGGAQQT